MSETAKMGSSESLSDKHALVTGGGTGIGRQFAETLAAMGAEVVICGRRSEPLEETAPRNSRRWSPGSSHRRGRHR